MKTKVEGEMQTYTYIHKYACTPVKDDIEKKYIWQCLLLPMSQCTCYIYISYNNCHKYDDTESISFNACSIYVY